MPKEAVGARQPPGKRDRTRTSITIALGDRWSRIVTDIRKGEYTWREFVEDLDDQELARAQLKDSEGEFRGRPPNFVPREFVLACQREMRRRFEEIFSQSVLEVAEQYVQLAQDTSIPAKDRAKLMQYAMERIFGPVPKEIKVTQEQPWEQVVANVVSDPGEDMPDHLARRYAGYAERQGGVGEQEE
jgi:hypothetical protein